MTSDERIPRDDQEPLAGEPAGVPVGHAGARVDIAERRALTVNGAVGVIAFLALLVVSIWLMVLGAAADERGEDPAAYILGSVLIFVLAVLIATAITIVGPGDTRVLQLFGRYVGTVRSPGLKLTLPLVMGRKVSVKVRNFETHELKVNDADGNPVNIAAIIVWQVADTAKAVFAVEKYTDFVEVQSESALRHVASSRRPCAGPPTWSQPNWPPRSRPALPSQASRSWRPGSPASPTPRRSPTPCCSASRPAQ